MFGQDCILPVELKLSSWNVSQSKYPMTTTELIGARTKQFARKEKDLAEAAKRLEEERLKSKVYFRRGKALRPEGIKIGDLVLMLELGFEKSKKIQEFVDCTICCGENVRKWDLSILSIG
jgi:hypothetical protein